MTRIYLSLFFLLFDATTYAQTVRGSILGRVTGAANQPIAGAAVTIVELETNQNRAAKTDAAGEFVVAQLQAGLYRVAAEAAGYSRSQWEVTLLVNQELNIELPMASMQTRERVEVRGEYGLLKTESASIGTVIANREIRNLPLDGRNVFELTLLVPGVVPAASGSAGSDRGDFIFNVNGAREDSNYFLLDGVFNNDPKLNGFSIAPPVDAVRGVQLGQPAAVSIDDDDVSIAAILLARVRGNRIAQVV